MRYIEIMIDRIDIQEALDQIDVLGDDKLATHAGLLAIVRSILDMAAADGNRELTIWEKSNIRLAMEAIANGHLPFAWGDLNEALADPADIDSGTISANEAWRLAAIRTEIFRQEVNNFERLRPRH